MKPTKPTTPADLSAKVLECIRLYTDPDTRIRKEYIASYCGLEWSDTVDRQIRDAVNKLRKQGHPIISSAGQAGYWYDPQAIDTLIADYQSRIADMSETVRALKRGHRTEIRQLELIA